MSEWISVKDKLPEKKGRYICALVNQRYPRIREFHDWCRQRPRFWINGVEETKVTHWMPLPELPK